MLVVCVWAGQSTQQGRGARCSPACCGSCGSKCEGLMPATAAGWSLLAPRPLPARPPPSQLTACANRLANLVDVTQPRALVHLVAHTAGGSGGGGDRRRQAGRHQTQTPQAAPEVERGPAVRGRCSRRRLPPPPQQRRSGWRSGEPIPHPPRKGCAAHSGSTSGCEERPALRRSSAAGRAAVLVVSELQRLPIAMCAGGSFHGLSARKSLGARWAGGRRPLAARSFGSILPGARLEWQSESGRSVMAGRRRGPPQRSAATSAAAAAVGYSALLKL